MKTLSWLALTLALLLPPLARAESVQVAVAANFAPTLKVMVADFQKQTGHRMRISPEATGKLYAQILNGAPYEVFLSADQTTPQKLAAQGYGIPASQVTYAVGRLALWSADPHMIDGTAAVLKTSNATHLAIANPKTAPYGAAAVSVMESLGVYARWQSRLVQGENIAQTYQFVGTGNAALGFVALSQISREGQITHGSAWVIDSALHPPLRQDALLLKRGAQNPAALAFMTYLRGASAQRLILQQGYRLK